MARKKKVYDDDDGRVIANMNVDGMPWYSGDDRRGKRASESDMSDLTKSEARAIVTGAMKAGLLVAGVFLLGALIFILFCVFVWFK
ncbi:MAG: hypothetical protein IJ017_03315 [Oscillospiraceae bacterium]|nr:hypothetical protein [Oscillospiraceae bacterium]